MTLFTHGRPDLRHGRAGRRARRRGLPAAVGLVPALALTLVVAPPAAGGRPAPAHAAAAVRTERLAGQDRYATAVAVARRAFPDGASTAVLAGGESFPDALSAAPLAVAVHAPVLLTAHDRLPTSTRDELERLGVSRVLVLGGPGAISPQVADQVARLATVERIGGADRYATSRDVARRLGQESDVAPADAIVVSGRAFPDGLVAGAAATSLAGTPAPVLLLDRTLSAATLQVLRDLGVGHVDVVGGPGVVPDEVLTQLRSLGVGVRRVGGANRQETAAAVARSFPGLASGSGATLVRPDGFPDALVAAPWSGVHHAPVLLSAGWPWLGAPTTTYLLDRSSGAHPVTLVSAIGGTVGVSRTALSGAAVAAGGRPSDEYRARQALARMTLAQRAGQTLLVGLPATGASTDDLALLRAHHVGSVFLRGRSSAGVTATRTITDRIRSALASGAPSGVGTLLATDQEGGEVQVLSGPGFSDMATAQAQGTWSTSYLRNAAKLWAGQLASAGIDLNLAPVLGVVPASVGTANAPLGRYHRQFGSDPTSVAASGAAFVAGMAEGGVATTAKHFPGLGRVDGNTDTTLDVTDPLTTADDPYLQPFRTAVDDGVPAVMMALATYPRIDAHHIAAFSPTLIGVVLRRDLGFERLVVSDSLSAIAVSRVPVGQRAIDLLQAGGDLALVTSTAQGATMASALVARASSDPGFAARLDDAALHVLVAKAGAGLL
ncbi:MAG: cell wall-binding repeat-containing protein [Motilibacteraceae bacterium]